MRDAGAPPASDALILFEDRASDSPLVERVWRSHSERAGRFLSVASPHWELVVARQAGAVAFLVRGPETRPSWADCPADGEWFAIRFKLGAVLRGLPASVLVNRQDAVLPALSADAFLLAGERWTAPGFDDAEALVGRLTKGGLLARDRAVEAVLAGETKGASRRTAQRHMARTTGMTRTLLRQIERARHATRLLRDGLPIAEVAQAVGYFDQAHLTRSLRRLVGQTPGEIVRAGTQLSFLYNTEPAALD